MSRSSSAQLEMFDGERVITPSDQFEFRQVSSATEFTQPRYDFLKDVRFKSVIAESAKIAGRNSAKHVSDDELRTLLKERKELIKKQLNNEITKKEQLRLTYVNWTIDRIEDARDGEALDRLEDFVRRYELFRDEIRHLGEQLEGIAKKQR